MQCAVDRHHVLGLPTAAAQQPTLHDAGATMLHGTGATTLILNLLAQQTVKVLIHALMTT